MAKALRHSRHCQLPKEHLEATDEGFSRQVVIGSIVESWWLGQYWKLSA